MEVVLVRWCVGGVTTWQMLGNLLRRKFEWKRLDCHLRHLWGNSCQRKGISFFSHFLPLPLLGDPFSCLSSSFSGSVTVTASGFWSYLLNFPTTPEMQIIMIYWLWKKSTTAAAQKWEQHSAPNTGCLLDLRRWIGETTKCGFHDTLKWSQENYSYRI